MKKFLISGICMVFLLCMLASCGGGTEGGSVENGEAEPPQEEAEEPKLLSQAELETLFQKVFDSDGDIQSQEDTQITAELSAVKEAADADTLPEDYETLYRSWREGQVTAWETEVEQLKADYKKMLLADTDLTAAWEMDKACYADYIDFDGNGIPELLTVTKAGSGADAVTVKVYGSQDGAVTELENSSYPLEYHDGWGRDNLWIRIFKNGDSGKRYLGVYTHDPSFTRNHAVYTYYTIEDGKWTLDRGFVSCNFDREGYVTGGISLYKTDDPEFFRGDFEWSKLGEEININGDSVDVSVMTKEYPNYLQIIANDTYESPAMEQHGLLDDLLGIKLTVNGEPVELVVEPFVEKGVFMAPVRPVLGAMNIPVLDVKIDYYDTGADIPQDNAVESPDLVIASTKKQTPP